MWREAIVDEWKSRTPFGKIGFPVWLLLSSVEWIAAAGLLAFIILAGNLVQAAKGSGSGRKRWMPDVYKNDRN